MKKPLQQDDVFLADLEAAGREPDALHLWWLGQSGFLLQWQGQRCLLDPYLSDSLTAKYAGTNRPHTRMTGRVIAPERLTGISVATSSHNHTDHLDRDTLGPILEHHSSLVLVAPEANLAFIRERLGKPGLVLRGMNDGTQTQVGAFRFTGLPSAHDDLETDPEGRHKYLGYVVECGPWTLYHSGDTRWYEGLEARLSRFHLDVGLLPINGWAPERQVAGNLNIEEAVALGLAAGMRLVVPHHFDMFTFNTADAEAFRVEALRRGLPARVLQNGERLTLRP
jgi:L-ascorbate metabolism protein UlaG (beta-lactamase superfamily)